MPSSIAPTEMALYSAPNDNNAISDPKKSDNEKVQMKKQLGLIEGIAIILGIIFGSGKLIQNFDNC